MKDIYLPTDYVTDVQAQKTLREMNCIPIGDCIVDPEVDTINGNPTFHSGYWWAGKSKEGVWIYAHFSKYDRG